MPVLARRAAIQPGQDFNQVITAVANTAAGATTLVVSPGINTVITRALVLTFSWVGNFAVSSVVDSLGNAWQFVDHHSSTVGAGVAYSRNLLPLQTTDTVTITWAGSATDRTAGIFDMNAVLSPATWTASSVNLASAGTAITVAVPDLLGNRNGSWVFVAAYLQPAAAGTVGGSFTELDDVAAGTKRHYVSNRVQSTSPAQSPSVTWAGAANACAVAFGINQAGHRIEPHTLFQPLDIKRRPRLRSGVVPPLYGRSPIQAGGTTFNQTMSASLATSVAVVRESRNALAASQATAVQMVRQPRNTLTATKATAVAVVRVPARILAATQATAVTVAATRVLHVTLSAVQATAATIVRQPRVALSATKGTAVTVARSANRVLAATQATSVAMVRKPIRTLAATVASAVTITTLRVYLVTIAATLATAVTIVRTPIRVISATQGMTVAVAVRANRAISAGVATSVAMSRLPKRTMTAISATVATTRRDVAKTIAAVQLAAASVTYQAFTTAVTVVIGRLDAPTPTTNQIAAATNQTDFDAPTPSAGDFDDPTPRGVTA